MGGVPLLIWRPIWLNSFKKETPDEGGRVKTPSQGHSRKRSKKTVQKSQHPIKRTSLKDHKRFRERCQQRERRIISLTPQGGLRENGEWGGKVLLCKEKRGRQAGR